MLDYKSVKIADEIIIVEKTYPYQSWITYREVKGQGMHQGYVVDANNKKMLETAKYWAQYHTKSGELVSGVEHKYKNGQFEIALCDSADNSSQSGKLSFWNCIVTCPDGKEFLIGINADILLELLLKNTFIDGKCKNKVWLGRIGGNRVGAFTENMELYKQAQKDEAKRKEVTKANTNYKPGDIVKTLTEKEIYLGTMYEYYRFEENSYRGNYYIIVYKKPKLVHAYRPYYHYCFDEKETLSSYFEVKTNKVKRIVEGHSDIPDSNINFISKSLSMRYKKAQEEYKERGSRWNFWEISKKLSQYGENPTSNREALINYLKEKYSDITKESINYRYKIIDEDEWEKISNK